MGSENQNNRGEFSNAVFLGVALAAMWATWYGLAVKDGVVEGFMDWGTLGIGVLPTALVAVFVFGRMGRGESES